MAEETALTATSTASQLQLQQQRENEPVKLKRQLGLLHGVAIVSGLTIGGGIYLMPRGVLVYAGSPGLSLIMWAAGGVLALLGALTYAEIGVVMPESGAIYAYLRRLYGQPVAFFYLWSYLFFARTGGNAVKCVVFGRYVLKPFFPDCAIPEDAVRLLASVTACVLTVINCIDVKLSARGQSVMTIISVTTLATLTVSGFIWVGQGKSDIGFDSFSGTTDNPGDWALALFAAIYSYHGWTALNFLAEEVKNPARNLPLSIVISVTTTTLLYVFVNFAYISVLGSEGVLQSEAVAVTMATYTLGPVAYIVPLLIALTACSSFNSGMMVSSRLSFAGSRNGHLPDFLALINIKFLTPITSLVSQGLLPILFIWLVDVYSLVSRTLFINLFFDGLTVVGYIRYRRSQSDSTENSRHTEKIAWKLPLAIPIAYAIILILLVAVPLFTKPMEAAAGLAIMLGTGVPYYVLVVLWTNKPASWRGISAFFTKFIQKLFYATLQEVDTAAEDKQNN